MDTTGQLFIISRFGNIWRMNMKMFWAFCLVLLTLYNVALAEVSGKVGPATVSTKRGEVPVFNYSYQIETLEKRIKKPQVSFYYLVQRPDTARAMHCSYWGDGPSGWDQAKNSTKAPEVDSASVRAIRADSRGSNFGPYYVFADKDKILVFRVELWQDGALLGVYNSKNEADLLKLGIKPEWYRKQ